jgi:hypothetical protein
MQKLNQKVSLGKIGKIIIEEIMYGGETFEASDFW